MSSTRSNAARADEWRPQVARARKRPTGPNLCQHPCGDRMKNHVSGHGIFGIAFQVAFHVGGTYHTCSRSFTMVWRGSYVWFKWAGVRSGGGGRTSTTARRPPWTSHLRPHLRRRRVTGIPMEFQFRHQMGRLSKYAAEVIDRTWRWRGCSPFLRGERFQRRPSVRGTQPQPERPPARGIGLADREWLSGRFSRDKSVQRHPLGHGIGRGRGNNLLADIGAYSRKPGFR